MKAPKEKKEKVPKEKKPKAPKLKKEKKARVPREKKARVPREKKPRAEKKPLFSFGKKKAVATVETSEGHPAGAMQPGEETETPGKKDLLSKKGPKQHRVKEPKAPKAKKGKKASGGFGGSKMSPVGLDLGRSSITAVRLRHQTGGSVLLEASLDTLPEGLIQEGEVRDVEALAYAIKEFWKTHKIKGKKVALGLANQKVVVRTLEFPLLEEKELRTAIEFQAQDYIPIPVEEAVFDFHVLGRFSDEEGIEKQKVLVVAVQKAMVMDFIDAVKKAKLSIAGVDLQAFSLLRALTQNNFLDQAPVDRATAIANIGSDITNLVIDVGGEPQFTRIIAFGGDDFTKPVQDMQGISFNEAEELKARAGLSEPSLMRAEEEISGEPTVTPVVEEFGQPEKPTAIIPPAKIEPEAGGEDLWPEAPLPEAESEEEMMANIRRVLEVTADALANELRRSLDYYMSQEQSVQISRLYISGSGAMLKNLDAHLSQLFPFQVEVGNPLLRISENKTDLTDEELSALAPRLTISIGLGLEDVE
ncbi:MAG: type IV pilus assembly protein PilM [Thermoleophilia bacterium]|nr:type IV pilus assembly protein PilM [Thermoleophilia bacterium]